MGTVRQKELRIQDKDIIKKKIDTGEEFKEVRGARKEVKPSPNTYNTNESFRRLVDYKPINTLGSSMFTQGGKRFTGTREKSRAPGPGTYNQKSEFATDRYKIYGAVFMSESKRDPFELKKPVERFAPFD